MPHRVPVPAARSIRALLVLAPLAGLALVPARAQDGEIFAAGPVPVDVFHPAVRAGESTPAPAFGGTAAFHLDAIPSSLNRMLDVSSNARAVLWEIHEFLIRRDWESWQHVPVLCKGWSIEDQLILTPEAQEKYKVHSEEVRTPLEVRENRPAGRHALLGSIEEIDGGFVVRRRQASAEEVLTVEREDVLALERGTVVTMPLREGVLWHPVEGFPQHALDARDVVFSWSCFWNPEVDCDRTRSFFEKILSIEVLDGSTLRFIFDRQYAFVLSTLADLPILPSHLYDLSDPDNPEFDPDASPLEQARTVNESPHNLMWVGLGPYRVRSFGAQAVEAERFDGYFNPADGGYLDVIRWRQIAQDHSVFQALLSGEIDFTIRLRSEDYFSPVTDEPPFSERFYKGYNFLGIYAYLNWNLHKPTLADVRVRQALAHCFDFEEFKRTYYHGLFQQLTGPAPFFSPAYNRAVVPFPFDLDRAQELLAEAGWYDRDGDGIADRDGQALSIELLHPAGNDPGRVFGLKLKENLERIGVELSVRPLEWGTITEKLNDRSFDAVMMAWSSDLEEDPEQIWHSRWGAREMRSSNRSGLMDGRVDALIESGQRETDVDARQAIWRSLHERLYELQPCFFLYNVPFKVAVNKNLRGLQLVKVPPGYVIRRLFYPSGTPGTRPQRAAK